MDTMTQAFKGVLSRACLNAEELGQCFTTGHIVLEMIGDKECVAFEVIKRLGMSLPNLRNSVQRRITRAGVEGSSEDCLASGRVIGFAWDEMHLLESDHLGTEHLLLGLIGEIGGSAGQALSLLGAHLERAREIVQDLSIEGIKER